MTKKTIPFEDIPLLHYLFCIDASGNLIRLVETKRSRVGDIAGSVAARGRIQVVVSGRTLYAHHIVWAMTHGEWPPHELDHINGNPLDNRPSNLRLADGSQNGWNRKILRNSTTGLKSVHFHKKGQKWAARVRANNKTHAVWGFETKELAYDFACLLRRHLHGEFAHD